MVEGAGINRVWAMNRTVGYSRLRLPPVAISDERPRHFRCADLVRAAYSERRFVRRGYYGDNEIADNLMADRGHADTHSTTDDLANHSRTGERFARAWGTLDG